LPHTEATSLALAGSASVDREPLLKALLREFAARYADWRAAEGDPERSDLRADYTALCDTVGREVRVITPGSAEIAGTGVDIDAEGRLVVSRADGSRVTVAAGDVVHVR
ncbi:MAG: biotin--[acetyl-CoA-carboxylase] ligase, partial [Micromonosporaceae bacterium]